jgi:hypothetical protein
MNLEVLLSKLQCEAEREADKNWKRVRLDLVKRKAKRPPTVTQSCRQRANALRIQTADIYDEIYERRLLEIAQDANTRANLKLLELNRTPEKRAARDEEVRDFQERYSTIVLEASPDWRSQDNPFMECYRQQMSTPVEKANPKKRLYRNPSKGYIYSFQACPIQ